MSTVEFKSDPAQREEQPQPLGLWTLSWTEMWERFSFYGLQVILAYYIYYSAGEGGLGLSDIEALAITGAYGGAVYISQPAGAWLADRLIPARTMVYAGGAIIMAGHIVLAVAPGLTGLFSGLALIVLGTGALFPNILAMMNLLFEENAPKRDLGFSLYYSGILIGSLLGPLVTGYLQITFGFHVGFAAAAIGMFAALLGLTIGLKTLPAEARTVPNPVGQAGMIRALAIVGAIVVAIVLLIVTGALNTTTLNWFVIFAALAISVGLFIVMHRSHSVDAQDQARIRAYIPLFITAAVFWTMILQLFTTFAIYADTRVDLSVGPITVPAAYISTFEVVTGIIAGPVIAAAAQRRRAHPTNRSTATSASKLALSFLVMAVTFVLFAVYAVVFESYVPLLAVIIALIFMGITEASYAPFFFSASGRFAPRVFNAQMMALASLTLAIGASLSGFMGQLYVSMDEVGYFLLMAVIAIACAGLLYASRRSWVSVGIR